MDPPNSCSLNVTLLHGLVSGGTRSLRTPNQDENFLTLMTEHINLSQHKSQPDLHFFCVYCSVFAQNVLTTEKENIRTGENWPQAHHARLVCSLLEFTLLEFRLGLGESGCDCSFRDRVNPVRLTCVFITLLTLSLISPQCFPVYVILGQPTFAYCYLGICCQHLLSESSEHKTELKVYQQPCLTCDLLGFVYLIFVFGSKWCFVFSSISWKASCKWELWSDCGLLTFLRFAEFMLNIGLVAEEMTIY